MAEQAFVKPIDSVNGLSQETVFPLSIGRMARRADPARVVVGLVTREPENVEFVVFVVPHQ